MNITKFSRRPIERTRRYHRVNVANQLLVIDCLMDGYSNREIAEALSITVGTVKKYISRISKRLQISDKDFDLRNRIVYLVAIQRGLIKPYETNRSELSAVPLLRANGMRHDAPSSHCNQLDDYQPWSGSGSSNRPRNTRRPLPTYSVV